MPTSRNVDVLLAAARLYYVENRSQSEVASILGTSRSNVSRMLTAAYEQGIVEIRIHDPGGRAPELEEQIRDRFRLREVRVAASHPITRAVQAVGVQASRLLLEQLREHTTVALSWGQALQALVQATTPSHTPPGVTLTQLVGGLSSIENGVSGQELVRDLSSRLDATYRILHAPATLTSRTVRQSLLAESSIADTLAEACRADLAVVGIGTPKQGSSAALLRSLELSPEEQRDFSAQQPVGDIAARYFDDEGRSITGAVADRVLAVTLDDLKAIPHVVGVAHGHGKAPGVLGALRGHIVDSLVCDEDLARTLIVDAT